MNDAELRSLERLCSKDDLSDGNVATLTVLGLKAASEIRKLRLPVVASEHLASERDEARARALAAEADTQQLRAELAEAHEALTAARAEVADLRTALDVTTNSRNTNKQKRDELQGRLAAADTARAKENSHE